MDDLLAPTSTELQSRIQELELRNVELEVRNVQLTKALASASVNGCNKFDVVNSYAHIIIARHLEKISSITSIAATNPLHRRFFIWCSRSQQWGEKQTHF